MQTTRKMLIPLITTETQKLGYEEMALQYKTDKNPCILATAFDRLYGLITAQWQNFPLLNGDDVASLALEKLDLCLQEYDKSRETKFVTMFTFYLNKKLQAESFKLVQQKRKANVNTMEEVAEYRDGQYEDEMNVEFMLPKNITDRIKRVCLMIAKGYTVAEIGEELGVTRQTIYSDLDRVKQKLILQN